MKVLVRIFEAGILVFLLLLTVCTAAYRLDPAVSPEVEDAAEQSLSDRITGIFDDVAASLQGAAGDAVSSLTSAAVDTAVSAVADVEPTGQYTDSGDEILDVTVPAGAVSTVTSAVSQELGTMVDAGALVEGLNGVEGVTASQHEDGSLTITVPEDLYNQYKDQLAGALGG